MKEKKARVLVQWIGCLALAFAAVPASAQGPRAVPVEPVFDAGVIVRGAQIEHTFAIKNEGAAALTLRDVDPSCGCTVARFDRTIAPGERGRVHAVVETKSFRGPIAKSITVYTNDKNNAQIRLVIKADVRPVVEAKPVYARFMTVVGEKREASEHLLWSTHGPALEVEKVVSPFPFLKASVGPASDEERNSEGGERQWKLTLELGARAPVGPLAEFVEVHTNNPEMKVFKLPVSGYVRPVLAVTPQRADFGRRDLAEPYEASLEIRNLGADEVEITSVASDVPGVESEIEEVEEGKIFMVRLTLTPEMRKGPFEGKIQIETTSALQPRVEVDLRGTVL